MTLRWIALVALSLVGSAIAPAASAQESVWRSYLDSARKAADQGDHRAAERFLAMADNEASAFPSGDTRRIEAWTARAALAEGQFHYDVAEALHKRSLAFATRLKKDEVIAHASAVLADHYRLRGKFDLAEPLYRKALAIRERVNGPNAWETAQLLRDLADLERDAGKFDAAEALYRRALTILEGTKGPEFQSASCLANLGELYVREGKLVEAEALSRRADAIYESLKVPLHLNRALCEGTLGEALRLRKKSAEAEEAFSAAVVHIDDGKLNTIRVADVLANAAKSARETGKIAQAGALEGRATALRESHRKANAAK